MLYRCSLSSLKCPTPVSWSTLMKYVIIVITELRQRRHCCVALWRDTGREGTCWNLKKEPEVELEINWYHKVLVQHYAHLVILFCINASCTWENPTHVAKSCQEGLCRTECSSSVCWCLLAEGTGQLQGWEQLSLFSHTRKVSLPSASPCCICATANTALGPCTEVQIQDVLTFALHELEFCTRQPCQVWDFICATAPSANREGGKDGINIHTTLLFSTDP